MLKRGSVELLDMDSNSYGKNISLDTFRSDSKSNLINSKQETVSIPPQKSRPLKPLFNRPVGGKLHPARVIVLLARHLQKM